MIFLDTNICVAALRNDARVAARMIQSGGRIRVPFVVAAELRFGLEKARQSGQQVSAAQERLEAFFLRVPEETLDIAVIIDAYAQIRARLEMAGTPIGANGLWIAAQVIAADAVLISANVREFSRVSNLRLDNWLKR